MEFSKCVVKYSCTLTVIMLVVTSIASFTGFDATYLSAGTALCFATSDVCIGFYFWKAKNENRIKLMKQMMCDWADKYGVESVAAIAEIVLKE